LEGGSLIGELLVSERLLRLTLAAADHRFSKPTPTEETSDPAMTPVAPATAATTAGSVMRS
jgi:hypothetical protein